MICGIGAYLTNPLAQRFHKAESNSLTILLEDGTPHVVQPPSAYALFAEGKCPMRANPAPARCHWCGKTRSDV